MQIRALKLEQPDSASSAVIFKCLAKNEFGSAERLIKLIVLNRPDRPEQVRVRDIWSRSALITWLAPASSSSVSGSFQPVLAPGNGISNRITNYTVQYWRKNQASGQTLGQPQNHRREEIVVDGLQNSALLINLMPAISYEISIVAFNQVGFSEPSEIINVTTSEEEPSLPPTDVLIEAKGATTLRVMWKTPPAESLNGKLLGFYVGYRPRLGAANNNNNVGANLNVPNQLLSSLHHHHHQQMQPVPFNNLISSASSTLNQHVHQGTNGLQQQQPALVYSFKTVDAIEGQLYYDSFLVNLKAGQEYEIIVRAFNKAGSGPDCHTILARTNAGAKLPPAPQLQLQKVGPTSVVLKWTTSVPMNPVVSLTQLKPSPGQPEVNRFILYYQLQGDRDWFELNVQTPPGAGYEQLQQLSGDNLNLNANNQQKSAMLLYLQDQTNEYMASQASVHTLSNLQPGLAYRIYVSAVNDYGIGDPSNILTIKTDSGSSSQAYLGAALLDSSNSLIKSTNSAGLFEGLLFGTSQQQQNLIFTTLSSISLFIILIIIAVYLIWQYKLRAKYNSSSTSSYPSSWTPAASDTIQSEYSISKRFPLSGANATSAAAAANALLQDVANYDEVSQLRNSSSSAIYRQSSRSNYNFNTNSTRTVGSQLMRNLQTSGTTARPVLSTHYHQPADLMSSSNSSATLQLHSTEIVRPSLVSAGARGQQQQQVQSTLSATLNRNQNRQLPPIPYSTLSVKEIGGPKQWRQQQPTNQMAIAQQQQQQQQGQVNYQANSGKSNGAGSQTPLIYGVIE